jgi:hypothetical protein
VTSLCPITPIYKSRAAHYNVSGSLCFLPILSLFHCRNAEWRIKRAEAHGAGEQKYDRQDAQNDGSRAADLTGEVQDGDDDGQDRPENPVSRSHVFLHDVHLLSQKPGIPSLSKNSLDKVNDAGNDSDAKNADHYDFGRLRHDQFPFLPLCIVDLL